MNRVKLSVRYAAAALFFMFLTGCAAGPQVKERFFWPPLPDTPRIEWLGTYQNQYDLKRPGFLAQIIGEDVPEGLQMPIYITSDGFGKVYVSDSKKLGYMVFDLTKKELHMLGGESAVGLFSRPSGVALDGEGNIYTADINSKKIMVFDRNETYKKALDLSKDVKSIGSITIDKARKRLIVPDMLGHQVAVYDLAGNLIRAFGKRGSADGELNYPTSVSLDKEGNLVVCDAQNARIQRFSPDGKFLSKFGKRGDGIGDFNIIKAAAVDSEGHIYVTDGKAHRISIFNEQGDVLLIFGGPFAMQTGGPVNPGGFLIPQGIYIDQNDTIYVVDQMNGRFQVFQYITEKYLKEHPITGEKPAQGVVLPASAPAR